MKIAFFALLTTTPVLLVASAAVTAGTNGKVELIYTGTTGKGGAGTDYVVETTPQQIQYTVTLPTTLSGATTTKTLSFTSASTQKLFSADGELTIKSITQGSVAQATTVFTKCEVSGQNKVTCTLATTTTLPGSTLLVIKLENKDGTINNLGTVVGAAIDTTATYTGHTGTALSLGKITVQKKQVQSGKVTLPPSSHVKDTTPTAFDIEIQPRQPLEKGQTITVTCNQALFTAASASKTLTTASAKQGTTTWAITDISCVVAADSKGVVCTTKAASAPTISTASPFTLSLKDSTDAKLNKLLAPSGTQYSFSYSTGWDTTVLGPQLAFATQEPQMETASVTLDPSTHYTGTTPSSITIELKLRQPLSATQKITVTPNVLGSLASVGALTVKSVSQGLTSNFVATVTSTALEIAIQAGGAINNEAPFKITLANGVSKIAPLGAVGQVVSFTFKTTLATVGLPVTGWTVVAAPANSAGQSFSPAAIPAGATCVQIYGGSGFYKGTFVQIGDGTTSEQRTITAIYTSTDCTGAERADGRRLADNVVSTRLDSALANAYPANTPITAVAGWGPTCFPGDAMANVYSRGPTNIGSLSVGDRVLVESVAGRLTFAPVLAFLHKVPGSIGLLHESVTVVHSQGTFRASANHLAFVLSEAGVRGDTPVSALRPGDQLLVQSASGKEMPSLILSIGIENTAAGMYAPFTSSGSLVVDGVIASNYGAPSSGVSLPHGAAHAAFFALRVSSYLNIGSAPKLDAFAKMMFQQLHLNKYA